MSSSSEESEEPETKKMKSQLRRTSQQVYQAAYQQFMTWKTTNNKDRVTEQVLLEYFKEQSETKSPSTLYSNYSMIRSIVLEEHGINMKQCAELQNFLKQQIVGFKPKESKLLTADNVEAFLTEAPDDVYLTHKVALLLGVYGACRSTELCYLSLKDIQQTDDFMIIDLKDKTGTGRSFVIRRKDHLNTIEKYQSIRPQDMTSDRFFLKCLKGKCIKQVIGKNKFCEMPSQIAEYLKLPNPKSYRGNCFRISSSLWYLTAKDVANLNEVNTEKLSNLIHEREAISAEDSEGTLIPAEFLNVEINVENTDDSKNAKTDMKDRLDGENFVPENENFDLKNDSPLKQIKREQCDSESESSEQESFLDPNNHESSARFETTDKNKAPANEHINSSTKVTVNQQIHETTIMLPNKTVKLVFKNCKNISNIRINL